MGDKSNDDTYLTIRDPLKIYRGRQALWYRGYDKSDERVVNEQMYSVFRDVKLFPFKRIVFQFWRPFADGGRMVLECARHPYALSPANRVLDRYRSCSGHYRYSIDDVTKGDNPRIIRGGLPATVFLNHIPEVVLDLRVLQRTPVVNRGLECDLTCCMMLPIFCPNSSQCVGVVECSMKHPGLLLLIFNELKRELERVGLNIYHEQGSSSCSLYKQAITGDLELAKREIEMGLEIACESHAITLGQVWISHGSENDHHASDTPQMKRMFLSGYFLDSVDGPLSSIKDIYDKMDVGSLKTGKGLVRRTLETHQPHLCRNIYKLSDDRGLLALLSSNTKSTSFVICLRSFHTGELDYAFEFFWARSRNHLILLETLLLTLRKYLQSFTFASGERLGDELLVVDVDYSSTKSRRVKIFPGNELSKTPKALKETNTLVGAKRKFMDLYEGQSDLNQSNLYTLANINNPEGEDDDDDLAILATYRNDATIFFLPISSTFENVKKKLEEEFELDPARRYRVEYEVWPEQWSSLVCLENCWRIEDTGPIKLRVLAEGGEVGWLWRTNGNSS